MVEQGATVRGRRMQNAMGVRLDPETFGALNEAADQFGISRADLIRGALHHALPTWERQGFVAFRRNKRSIRGRARLQRFA